MPVASFSLPASRDGLSLCRSSWELCAAAASKGAERRAARRERKTKRGRSLPAAILVDLDRRNLIRRPREAQGVDGISFTVHPLVGKLNTVRPWLRPIGAIDGSHAVVASTGCSPVLQTVRGRVPECQGGDSLLRLRCCNQDSRLPVETPNIIAEAAHSQFVQWKHEVVLGISIKLSIL